jgi:SAM-dependent methyltransferase
MGSESSMDFGFKCLKCHSDKLLIQSLAVTCEACHESYPIHSEVFDFLYQPGPDIVKELTGMAVENGFEKDKYLDFKVKLVPASRGISEKLDSTQNDYNQYYQQTIINFNQAFNAIKDRYNFKGANVLEIGSCYDYYFLKPFKEMEANCFGLNLHFNLTSEEAFQNFPIKVLADMNNIPFQDSFFDVVVISATSHHSNTPEKLVSEIHRILKTGGASLIINDPINGLLKGLGSKMSHNRHDHINENEYTLSRYNKAFGDNNFEIHHLFSDYHDQKLLTAKIHPNIRFARLARVVASLWKINFIRNLLKK